MTIRKIYVIKFSLTRGILIRQAEVTQEKGAWCEETREYFYNTSKHQEFYYTLRSAALAAEEMRKAKIVLLEKQLATLKKLKIRFEYLEDHEKAKRKAEKERSQHAYRK